jgi:hypothetical protein
MTAVEGIWLCVTPQHALSKVHSDPNMTHPFITRYIFLTLLQNNRVSCFTARSQQDIISTVLNEPSETSRIHSALLQKFGT